MFSVLIKKNKGDVSPFGVNVVIEAYTALYGQEDVLIIYPGYQSIKKRYIDCLCSELRRVAPQNKIYLANGINGARIEPSTGKTVHDCHVPPVEPTAFGKIDHSKCIVFADKTSFENRVISPKALLVGSSNVSYNTYLHSPADKGEMDVFLMIERFVGYQKGFVNIRKNVIEMMAKRNENSEYTGDSEYAGKLIFSKSFEDEKYDDALIKSFLGGLSEMPQLISEPPITVD